MRQKLTPSPLLCLATLGIGAFTPIPEGYELLSIVSGAFGLYLRSYLLASLPGRGGWYFLEAALVLVLGEAVRSLSEPQLYSIIGVASLIVLAAYLLRERWLPENGEGPPSEPDLRPGFDVRRFPGDFVNALQDLTLAREYVV